MHSITYKMEYSALELIFGLIGPAIILASLFYPLHDLKIGSLRFGRPAGAANGRPHHIGRVRDVPQRQTSFNKTCNQRPSKPYRFRREQHDVHRY